MHTFLLAEVTRETNRELLFHGLGYAAAYAIPIALVLAGSFFLLDVITPGHKLGGRMGGVDGQFSYSAGIVSAAWMLAQSFVLYTAIMQNGDSRLDWALINTVAFGAFGALLLAGTFLIVDVLTPGKLADEVCKPGPVVPLAIFTAGSLLGMGLIVAASITG